jgi:hypothetical protein
MTEDFCDTWDWDEYHTYSYAYGQKIFSNCYSLRKIPTNFLKNLWNRYSSYHNSGYYATFKCCYVLDEVKDFGITTITLTSNYFQDTFKSCYRLKELTFETNEDGTPKTANWKSQVIDL